MLEIDFAAASFAVLAVWRVTHLVVAEDGPWYVFQRLRRAAAAIGLERLVSCFYCASVWIAIGFAPLVASGWRALLIVIPALSGGAIACERLMSRDDAAAIWFEEKEERP